MESLQLAVNVAMDVVNAQGSSTDIRLQDIPTHVQEIALHGIRCGASVALAAAQVQIGYDLHTMEISFLMGDVPEEHEELIEDFVDAAEAIVDITSVRDVVNKVFE